MGSNALSGKQVNFDWKPKVRDDIYFNDIFSTRTNGYYIVGSLANDSQVLFNSKKFTAFTKLLDALNGENTVDDLIHKGYGEKEELEKIVQLCYDKGLLTDSEKVERFNEVERLSVKLFQYKFKNFSENWYKTCKIAVHIFRLLFVVVLAVSLYLFASHTDSISGLTIRSAVSYKGDAWGNVAAGYLLIQVLCLFMGVMHEISHIVVSLKNRCQPNYVAFVLHLGFMPMAYVKQKSIYSLEKKKILEVLFAGVIMNFFLFLIFFDIYLYTGNDICKLLAVTNLRLMLINLMPFSLTDSYYIFSILLKKPNLRMKFFRFLAYPGEIKKYDWKLCVCFVVYLVTIIFCFNVEAVVLLNVINGSLLWVNYMLLIPLNIIYLVVINRVNKNRFKGYKVIS